MLYPSDPSCSSSKVSEVRADEKNSEQLKLQELDPVLSFGETPNFCIRDYVFASRCKKNGSSWPFRHRLLKLCLKHGIRDPLPPFEPSSSVRDIFCRNLEAESKNNIKVNLPKVGEICSLDGELNPTGTLSRSPSDDKFYNLSTEDCEIGSTLTNQCDIERFSTQFGAESAEKKCGLILKTGFLSDASRAEEIISTCTASDLMASKVCPVCKTFSSTSNTTLNAHMDQCLSMASDATKVVDKIQKIMVKPTKKRLMEDIYATARHCSLEDLDRRNGTSWAIDLSLVIPPTDQANAEPKKIKFSQLDAEDDRNEGAVYVDSNGIKVRILSKFNDSPQVISKKVFRQSKNVKLDGKNSLINQKMHFVGVENTKKMKWKMKNKKLSSLKPLKNEGEPEIDHEESYQEEGSANQLSNQQEKAHLSCGTSILQKWHCSKRSDLPKKICNSNFLNSKQNPNELMTQMTNLDKRNSASGACSSAKRHFVKLSHTPEGKMVDFSANAPLQITANDEKSSQGCSSKGTSSNVLRLKLWKASGASVPSKSSRNCESLMGRKEKLAYFPETKDRLTEKCNLSLKTRKISTLSNANLSTKMLVKRKKKREISYNSNEEQQICVEAATTSVLAEEITDRSLRSGSCQCQDVKIKSSALQTENMGFSKFIKASENVDGNSLVDMPINGEIIPGLLLNSDDKTSQNMLMKECGISMERPLLDQQDEKNSDRLESRGVESQARASSTDSSACLTSYGDLGSDTPRENCCSIASDSVVPNQESNLAINGEPSGSPVSSSSISPTSLNNSLTIASDRELVSMPLAIHEHLRRSMADNEYVQAFHIDHNQQCKSDSTMNKLLQQSDYHPCCCSRQSIMASTMPTSRPKLIPNLHISPSLSSSFGAYSISYTDTGNISSVESPTGSIMARSCSVVGSTSPSCGTPSQSTSNSILRLMGKNLMVTHNEDYSNLLQVDSPAIDNNSAAHNLASPLSFASYISAPLMTNRQVHSDVHQSNVNHKAYVKNEVIVLDGSSNDDMMMRGALLPVPVSHAMFHEPYPYFLPKNQLFLKEIGSTSSYVIEEGSSLKVPATLLPRPFVFRSPSTTHLNPPLYHPQSLR